MIATGTLATLASTLPERLRARARSAYASDTTLPLLIAVATRIPVILLMLAVFSVHGPTGPETSPFGAWDNGYYRSISVTGYHAAPSEIHAGGPMFDFAFFPLMPIAIAVASLGGLLNTEIVSGVLSNILFAVGMVAAFRLMAPTLGRGNTARGLLFFGVTPLSAIFSFGYAESMAFAVAALALLAARPHVKAPLAFLSGLSRVTGAAVSAVALVGPIRDRRLPTRSEIALLLAGPAAFGLYFVLTGLLTGSPTGYLRGTASWADAMQIHQGLMTWVDPFRGLEPSLPLGAFIGLIFIFTVPLPLLGLARLIYLREWEWVAFAAVSLVPVLFFDHWRSSARHALSAFVCFVAVGAGVRPGPTYVLLIGVSAVFELGMTASILAGGYCP